MATNTLPLPSRCLTPNFNSMTANYNTLPSSTPGLAFLNRKPAFATVNKGFYHYKFEGGVSQNGTLEKPKKRRATMNICFNAPKNEVDPYVNASNWLPKFKAAILGFLARQRVKKLREKNDAVRIIQNACSQYMDPWLSLFFAVKPLLKTHQIDDLKKLLHECLIQIKRLQSERVYIEGQMVEIEETMNQSLTFNQHSCISLGGRKSPNPFKDINSINHGANNVWYMDYKIHPVIQKVLKLEFPEFKNLEDHMDTSICYNSKVQELYDLSDKVLQRIHEDRHTTKSLQEKLELLERDCQDLRSSNNTLKNSFTMQKGVISKYDKDILAMKDKIKGLEDEIEKMKIEKNELLKKIKDYEQKMSSTGLNIEELHQRFQDLNEEMDKKSRIVNNLTMEKTRSEKKIRELQEQLNYANESQQELEATFDHNKDRMREMKRRFTDQLRQMEEETAKNASEARERELELQEMLEAQIQELENSKSNVRRLEKELYNLKEQKPDLDEEDSKIYERQHTLTLQLKSANQSVELKEDEISHLKTNLEKLNSKVIELEDILKASEEEKTEYKKKVERQNGAYETLKSTKDEIELNLNRYMRDNKFLTQKLKQSKDRCESQEAEINSLQRDLDKNNQLNHKKNRDMENLQDSFEEMKKDMNLKISATEKSNSDLTDQLSEQQEKTTKLIEDHRKQKVAWEEKLDEMQQMVYEKEDIIEKLENEKMEFCCKIKKLNRRIRDYEEVQKDNEDQINRLKMAKSMLEGDSPSPTFSLDTPTRIWDSRSSSSGGQTTPTPTHSEGYATLPNKSSSKKYP